MKLMTEYDFVVSPNVKCGVDVVLTQLESGKTKEFYVAAGSIAGLTKHMNSLTDDLCSSWFNVRDRQKKAKKPQDQIIIK